MLSELSSFNAARRYGWSLLAIGLVFALLGAVLSLTLTRTGYSSSPGVGVPRALGYLGLGLWTTAAAFLSSAILSFARQHYLAAERRAHERSSAAVIDPAGPDIAAGRLVWRSMLNRVASQVKSRIGDPESLMRWPSPLVAMLFAVPALAGSLALLRAPAEPAFDPLVPRLTGAGLIILAFPLLVLERLYANMAGELLPEAPQLERLLRLPLTACLALAAELILRSIGFIWAVRIEWVIGLLVVVVSLEMILRCVRIVFVPFAPIECRQSLADSAIAAALLRLRPPSLRNLNIAVRRQLGIDLSRSWALAFIQKAALPVFAGIGVFAWAVTGVTALSIDQRGVYERLGVPVTVLGPGLHVHLPWPLGQVRLVEFGVIHLLPIEFLLPGGADAEKSASVGANDSEQVVGVEAAAPEDADRLWTDNHPFEGNYLIASEEDGRQSFQLVDIDMAVMYRVGLSEQAARSAAYRVTDIDELIQAVSGQLLVQYFTHNTLLDLLGRSRETFTAQFRSALQAQLDHFSTGIEAIGVSVEAIHPPPGAADAYHNVQAAEIAATTQISLRRGDATRSLNLAQQQAVAARNEASAAAAERLGEAQAQSVLFAGDRQAYAHGGYPFLFERWLDDLVKGLAASPFVVIDHRLTPQSMPALDLRGLRGLQGPRDEGSLPAAPEAKPSDVPLQAPNGPASGAKGPARGDEDEDDD